MKSGTDSKDVPIRDNLRRIILERIVRGKFAPGIRIKEAQLAEELGTSRTPLREALINLEQEGFVRSELAHGFSVEPLSGREVRETYPILWTLETLALQTSGNSVLFLLEDLTRINAKLAEAREPEERLNLDTQWHDTLLSRCPNRRLMGLITRLRDAVRRYEYQFMSEMELVAESVHQHKQIIDALQARDNSKAERILTENWRVGMELLLNRL